MDPRAERFTNITPREFEMLVRNYLAEAGQGLKNLEVKHDEKMSAYDGTYQIDVTATFEIFGGSSIVVLVECKHYNKRVQRDDIILLNSKLQSIGAHKGILCSNAGFQQGAVDFAKAHGIALISIIEGRFTYKTKSQNSPDHEPPPWADIPKYVGSYSHTYTENSHMITYLQNGHMEDLTQFIFG